MISAILTGVVVGVLAWLAANWIGKPIVEARDKRVKALHAAEQNSFVGSSAGDARIATARAALSDAASGLRSISRSHWPVRLYFRTAHIDPEAAANALIGLHNMTGEAGYDDETRQLLRDAVYVLLGAHQHLSRKRIDQIREQLDRERRLADAKF
jgi:hypothetical protein